MTYSDPQTCLRNDGRNRRCSNIICVCSDSQVAYDEPLVLLQSRYTTLVRFRVFHRNSPFSRVESKSFLFFFPRRGLVSLVSKTCKCSFATRIFHSEGLWQKKIIIIINNANVRIALPELAVPALIGFRTAAATTTAILRLSYGGKNNKHVLRFINLKVRLPHPPPPREARENLRPTGFGSSPVPRAVYYSWRRVGIGFERGV